MTESEPSLSRRDFALCTGGLLGLLGAGGADVALSYRAHDPAALAAAAARVEFIPDQIGNWTANSTPPDGRMIPAPGIAGRIDRTYRNSVSGYEVSLTVLCGTSSLISNHPPDACIDDAGYELSSGPTVVAFNDGGDDQFTLNRALFRISGSSLSDAIRVFWGWSDNGVWTVPANPRLAFRGLPFLYKLYVTDRTPSHTDDIPQSESFLEDALPEIRRRLDQP
ncbi:MAG: exosortase-associated EpsI family protein [Planctomycetaceae bacterium]|nr:exosortase-associated EpsI family protein [Planctomycetaceae bacterium]